jgi:hypothetical protein
VAGCNHLVRHLHDTLDAEQKLDEVGHFARMCLGERPGALQALLGGDDAFEAQSPATHERCRGFLDRHSAGEDPIEVLQAGWMTDLLEVKRKYYERVVEQCMECLAPPPHSVQAPR